MLRIGLLLAMVVLVLEISLITLVSLTIGGALTVCLLVAGSLVGGWLMRREGLRAWGALRGGLMGGPPDRALAGSGMIMAGGALLLFPGFLTDVLGLVLLLPVTRPFARRGLAWFVDRRMRRLAQRSPYTGQPFAGPYAGPYERPHDQTKPARNVVPGQVVTDEEETRR